METRLVALLTSVLSLALLAVALLLEQAVSVQASSGVVRYVAPGDSCGSRPYCYPSVQAAVDAAAFGDEIRVAPGVYTDTHARPRNDIQIADLVTQVVYITKTVTLRGGYNNDFTIWDPQLYTTTLDAQGRGRVIYISGNISPTIEGFSITGGDATGLTGYELYGTHDVGGGVYVRTAAPTLNNNRVFGNTAPFGGGGVFMSESDAHVNDNTIFDNRSMWGGGLFLDFGSATLNSNRVISNTANYVGGGLFLRFANPTVVDSLVAENAASYGGGLFVAAGNPVFGGNVISGNTAYSGGGMVFDGSTCVLINNAIVDNHATESASGLYFDNFQTRLVQTTVARNTGGDGIGILITDSIGVHGVVTIINTVLVSQTTGIRIDAGSTATVEGILWFGNGSNTSGAGTLAVTNAFTGDPAFALDGYHLTSGSAAIDRGVSSGISRDIDGLLRFGIPDLGADEYLPPGLKYIFLPITSRDN